VPMQADLNSRIEAMFMRDKLFAWSLVVVLWVVEGFVLWTMLPYVPDGGTQTVACIAVLVLVVFNTASIAAMVRHYSHDKEHVYGTDIRHLDAGR